MKIFCKKTQNICQHLRSQISRSYFYLKPGNTFLSTLKDTGQILFYIYYMCTAIMYNCNHLFALFSDYTLQKLISGVHMYMIELIFQRNLILLYAGKPKVALRFLMLTQTWAFVREIIQYLVITLGNYLTLDFRLGKRKFFKGFIQTICFITKFRISEYANAQFSKRLI